MTNVQAPMTNQAPSPNDQRVYDLEERTAKFGENIITFCRNIPEDTVTRPLISQLTRSATSIGANYMEADSATTKRDFQHKIGLCLKEAKETQHWLRMLSVACPAKKDDCRFYWKEVHELLLIFSTILKSSKLKSVRSVGF